MLEASKIQEEEFEDTKGGVTLQTLTDDSNIANINGRL